MIRLIEDITGKTVTLPQHKADFATRQDELEARVELLEARVDSVQARVEQLERQVDSPA